MSRIFNNPLNRVELQYLRIIKSQIHVYHIKLKKENLDTDWKKTTQNPFYISKYI